METPRIFIIAKLSIRKLRSSSVLIIKQTMQIKYLYTSVQLVLSCLCSRLNDAILGFNDSFLEFNDSILGFNDSILEFNDSVLGFNDSLLGINDSILGFNDSILIGFNDSLLGFNHSLLGFNDSITELYYSLEERLLYFLQSTECPQWSAKHGGF